MVKNIDTFINNKTTPNKLDNVLKPVTANLALYINGDSFSSITLSKHNSR